MSRLPDDMTEIGGGAAFAIAFRKAPPALSPFIGSVQSYYLRVPAGFSHEELYLPAAGAFRFHVFGDDWAMKVGDRHYDPVPRDAVFGPTSCAGLATVATGQMVEITILPNAWSRLVPVAAAKLANQAMALSAIAPDLARDLAEALNGSENFEEQATEAEARLLDHLSRARPAPPEVAQTEALLLDPEIGTVEQATQALGMPQWRFARLSKAHFGFTPKLLMRRARFMRTILRIREKGAPDFSAIVDASYTDQSHFIRDCHDFLGMTPGQFAARFQPIAHASFNAREEVTGNRHHLVASS